MFIEEEGQKDHEARGKPASDIMPKATMSVRGNHQRGYTRECGLVSIQHITLQWWLTVIICHSALNCGPCAGTCRASCRICCPRCWWGWPRPCSGVVLNQGCCSTCRLTSERPSSVICRSCLKFFPTRSCWNGAWNPQDCCLGSAAAWMLVCASSRFCTSFSWLVPA